MTRKGGSGPAGRRTNNPRSTAPATPPAGELQIPPQPAVIADEAPLEMTISAAKPPRRRNVPAASTGKAAPEAASEDAPLSIPRAPAAGPSTRTPLSPELLRRRRRLAVAAAAILAISAVGVATGVGKALDGRHPELRPRHAALVPAAIAEPLPAEAAAITADYRPPDRDQVRRAYQDVGRTYGAEGLSGVVRLGMDCFASLEHTPGYAQLDYCLAYDAYGAVLQQHLTGAPLPADAWFAGSQARDLKAARLVVARDGDPSVRLFDVRRLAAEVSHEDGDQAATASEPASPASARDQVTVAAIEAAPAAPVLTKAVAAAPRPRAALDPAPARPVKPVPRKAAVTKASFTRDSVSKAPRTTPKLAKSQTVRPSSARKAAAGRLSVRADDRADRRAAARSRKPSALQKAEASVSRLWSRATHTSARRSAQNGKTVVSRDDHAKASAKARKPQPQKAGGKTKAAKASVPVRTARAALRPKPLSHPAVQQARYREDMPVLDCRRPIGRSEKALCRKAQVAVRDRRSERYAAWRPDGDGTLGGQLARQRREESGGGW